MTNETIQNTIPADAIPADVTPELISAAVAAAQRWHRPGAGMYTMADALAAGWRGQPMHTVCRPQRGGVGGDYWHEWDGGAVSQRTRSCSASAAAILAAMRDEYDRQTAAEKAAAEAIRMAAEKAAAENAAAEEADWQARRRAAATEELAALRGKTGRHARQRRAELRWLLEA